MITMHDSQRSICRVRTVCVVNLSTPDVRPETLRQSMARLAYLPVVGFGLIASRLVRSLTEVRSDTCFADRNEEVLQDPGQPRTS